MYFGQQNRISSIPPNRFPPNMNQQFKSSLYFLFLLTIFMAPFDMNAQSFTEEFKERFLWHFGQSSDKVTELAEAMPEETYGWSPDGEAMSVARVFMHIARHNYIIPERWLGIPVPDHIRPDEMEGITDKEVIIETLHESVQYVKTLAAGLTEEQLIQKTEIFGEETEGWAALMLLIAHMNEHVGQ